MVQDLVDHASTCDFSTNTLERTYPAGLDVEAFFIDVLHRADRRTTRPEDREHVTCEMRSRSAQCRCRNVKDDADNSDLRWVVDWQVDLDVVRAIYAGLGLDSTPKPYQEVIAFVRSHPQLATLNVENETSAPR